MSKDEIDRKMKEVDQYAEEDKKRKEKAEAKNEAEALIYTCEKTMSELKEKITKEQKERIDKSVKELKEAMESDELARIRNKSDELKKVVQEVGTYIYQQAGAGKEEEGKPVNAEFETKEEDRSKKKK